MNHIADANKMVSDTPRTDEAYFKNSATMYDLAGEMKQIERELNVANEKIEVLLIADCERLRIEEELNAANDRIKRLEAVVNDPHALWANWLRGDVKLPAGIGDVRQYQDRIRRLEEAVDAYRKAYTPDGHVSPHDCFATGPKTGNPIEDLIACPGCLAERKAKEAKP